MVNAVDLRTELHALREEVARLWDRSAIEDVLFEYAAAMDGQDIGHLTALFTPDVVIEHANGRMVGRDEVVAGLRQAVGRHFTSHHMISNARVAAVGNGQARAVGYFHSVHLDDPEQPDQHEDHGGWYLAELARTDEGWRLRSLKQVSVWSAANRRPSGPLDAAMLEELRGYLSRTSLASGSSDAR
jgi:ketosteroid isomerase-like protein